MKKKGKEITWFLEHFEDWVHQFRAIWLEWQFVPRPVCPRDSLSPRQFVPKTVCPQDSSSPNQFVPKTVCPQWQFVPKSLSPGINYFGDKLSWGQIGLGTNCLGDKLSQGQTVLGTNCPGDKFFGDKLSRDKLSRDKLLCIHFLIGEKERRRLTKYTLPTLPKLWSPLASPMSITLFQNGAD